MVVRRFHAEVDRVAIDIQNGDGHIADLHRLTNGEFNFGFVHSDPP